jgi:hypothetical protein
MSRKLIFASGLLVCFSPNLDPDLQTQLSTDKSDTRLKLVNYIRDHVRMTPLEIVARSVERYGVPDSVARDLFGAYSEFLKMLNDESSRNALDSLRSEDSRTDPTFKRVREISRCFESALDHIFFENQQITALTRKYGVF